MKWAFCWLFNALAVLALLLCVATAAWWVRSQFANDYKLRIGPVRSGAISSFKGRLVFWSAYGGSAYAREGYLEHGQALEGEGVVDSMLAVVWNVGGLLAYCHERDMGMDHRRVVVHYGILMTLALILPTARSLSRITRRSGRPSSPSSSCLACGYDLRATPGRCPECGTAVSVKVAS